MKCRNLCTSYCFIFYLFIYSQYAQALDYCGIVSIDEINNHNGNHLFLLDTSLVIAKNGALHFYRQENITHIIPFKNSSERLFQSIRWKNNTYLLTTNNRTITIYELKNSATNVPSIALVREVPFKTIRAERELYSPLLDLFIRPETNTIFLLGNFTLWKTDIDHFFSTAPLVKEEYQLSTNLNANEPRPVALEPAENGLSIFYADPIYANTWYRAHYFLFDSNTLTNGDSYYSDIVRKISSRNSAILETWFVYNKKIQATSNQMEITNEIAWPVDSFQHGNYQLISFFDYGTYLYKDNQIFCQMSPAGFRSTAIYEFNGIAGKEYILLGIDFNGKLHRVAMLPH